ncbi:MAG: hypothetical protein M1832_001834 [Thelocarpon impressellum]|nr:MAG: hypothetical protein M1832_001834 [Thelocarpon impressellum]
MAPLSAASVDLESENFPGKADSLSETPFQTARREAHEEIGLPPADADLPPPFRVEHLCELPTNLARTELGVRPCVAFLHDASEAASSSVQDTLIPRLDAREVAAVFSAPFHDFLSATATAEEGEGEWYEGSWTNWHGTSFRMHNFFVPLPTPSSSSPPHSSSSAPQSAVERHRVFGMTARILVDGARVAYAEPPAFAHLPHLGDEELLRKLSGMGRLGEKEAVREIGEGGGKGAKM